MNTAKRKLGSTDASKDEEKATSKAHIAPKLGNTRHMRSGNHVMKN